jgi:hypothetical protein
MKVLVVDGCGFTGGAIAQAHPGTNRDEAVKGVA